MKTARPIGVPLSSLVVIVLAVCITAATAAPPDVDVTWPSVGPRSRGPHVRPGAIAQPVLPVPQIPSLPGRVGTPVVASGFNGANGVPKDGSLSKPPDTHIAVGPGPGPSGRVVMVTNSDVEIWDKTGALLASSAGLSNFVGESAGTAFDPKVIYDTFSRRFFIVMLEGGTPTASVMHMIVSTTATPSNATTDWVKMKGDALANLNGSSCWSDYPSIGSDANSLFVTANLFDGSDLFQGAKIRVFDKSKLFAGTYSFVDIDLADTNAFTIQPAHTYETTDSGDFYLINRVGSANYRLWEVSGAPSAPVVVTSANSVWSSGAQVLTGAPQKGTGIVLDPVSGRVMNAVYRNGSVWCVLSTDTQGDSKSEVFWARIATNGGFPNAPKVAESGSIAGSNATQWTFLPSINANAAGDAAICFSRSGSAQFPEMRYATRNGADPPGTFQASRQAAASPGFYDDFGADNPERWGDFSATVVDPDGDTIFWAANELALSPGSVANGTRWNTFVAHLGPVVPAGLTSTPPWAFVTGSVTAVQSGGVARSVVAAMADAETPLSGLSAAVSGAPVGLTVSVQRAAGAVTTSAQASAALSVGPHPVLLTVTDGDGLTTTVPFTVFVIAGANTAPILGN